MTNMVTKWWREHGSWRTLYLLFLGQLVSFILALMSFTSSFIASQGVDAPLTQSLFIYLSVALVYGSVLIYKRQPLRISWYWYLMLAFVDVQASYFINKAYQFTSITSVTLLDCLTIAWIILLTRIFLGTRYSLSQLFGVVICISGLSLVLVSDSGVGAGGGSNPLLGDALVIVATIFFALSNVGEEFCVKMKDRVEVICMIGVFGFLITMSEIPFVELKSLKSVTWTVAIVLPFVGYVLAGFSFLSIVSYVLKMSGAAMFSLSILTADMWVVVFRIYFYRQKVDWLYYISFVMVVIGLVIYSLTGKVKTSSSLENGDSDQQHQLLAGENLLPEENGHFVKQKDRL